MDITPSYLRNPFSETGLVTDYRNWQIPLGRRFRALKIWFVMRVYGTNGLKAFLRNGMYLGDVFADLVRSRSDLFEIVGRPQLGLTVFRVREGIISKGNATINEDGDVVPNGVQNGPSTSAVDEDPNSSASITKEVYERVNATKELFLTSSVVVGRYVIRLVSGNENAREEYVRIAFEKIVQVTEEVLKTRGFTSDSVAKN